MSVSVNWRPFFQAIYMTKEEMVHHKPSKSWIGWPKRQECTSSSCQMAKLDLYKERSTRSCHQMSVSVNWRPFFQTIYILQEGKWSITNQANLGLDDLGDKNVQVQGGRWLGKTYIKRGVINTAIWCQYWWNDDHSSRPFTWQNRKWSITNQANLGLDDLGDKNVQVPAGRWLC